MELIFVIKRDVHVIYSDVSGKGRQARWMLNDLRIEISLRVIELIHEAITLVQSQFPNFLQTRFIRFFLIQILLFSKQHLIDDQLIYLQKSIYDRLTYRILPTLNRNLQKV